VPFITLDAIGRVLECQPGDLLRWVPDAWVSTGSTTGRGSSRRGWTTGRGSTTGLPDTIG
jgi:hypothetical protein